MADDLKGKNEEEFRQEQLENIVEFLGRTGAYDYFRDIISGKEVPPDFEKFKDFIIRINGIARDIPMYNRSFDGVNVGLSGIFGDKIVPKHEDKEGILKYAYQSIPEVNKDELKYMLPVVVNAVHLFADGNGRTSRILNLLLSEHLSEQDFLEKARVALGKFGRVESPDINPGLIDDFELTDVILKKHGWTFNDEEPKKTLGPIGDTVRVALGFSGQKSYKSESSKNLAEKFFKLARGSGSQFFGMTSIYMLLGDKGIKPLLSEYGENKRKAISEQKMADILTDEEWEELINNWWQLKKEEVESLVDIFRKPEEYRAVWENKVMPIKDIFIAKIKKEYERNKASEEV